MSSEITDAVQIIHILFEGTDLFLRVAGVGMKPLKQLTKLIAGMLMKEKMEGKTSMKNLLKRGGDMHVFKFPQEQLKKVEAMAKKYGILYSLLPDFNKDGMRELVFHAQSLPRMNALIEKLKAGQVMDLEEYFRNTSDRDIDKFYEENRGRKSGEKEMGGKEAGAKETESMQKNTDKMEPSTGSIGKEQKPAWMETGYLKIKDIEAIPLDQRLNILNHYQSGEYDPVTITAKLVIREEQDYVVVRLPRQMNQFIHIPKSDFWFPEGSRTALAFLKKKEEMKIYGSHGDEIQSRKGMDIFHEYFDTVNANIRTAMEHKSEKRVQEQSERESGKESGRTEGTRPPETGKAEVKNRIEKAAKDNRTKDTAAKTRNPVKDLKEIKQPAKGR